MSSALPTRVGRYEIVGRLGAGGMGVVYLASDPLLRRTVAIKVLPGEHDDDLRERFLREAQSVASLRHPNIVTIYDIGEEQGRLFIAMERIEGQSMAEAIDQVTPYSVERRVQLMLDLCAGLGYAHKQGIIHRDIKPGNLMIGSDGALRVLDFGLARLTTSTQTALTRSGALVGTPNYMSPEQVQGTPIDHCADIFSVGLVLYELLSYRRAFSGESIHTLLHDIAYKEPTPIGTLVPDLDPRLAAVVEKAIQKDVARRYQDLEALRRDLERVIAVPGHDAPRPTVIVDAPTVKGEALPPTVSAVTVLSEPKSPPPSRGRLLVYAGVAVIVAALVITAALYPRQPAPAAPLPPSLAAPEPSTPVRSPEPQAVAPGSVASTAPQQVSIDVMPWARVRIVPVGHEAAVPAAAALTPFSVSLAPGDYRLECENGGVSPRTVIPITVQPGRPLTVTRAMQGFNASQLVDSLLGSRP